MRTTVFYYGVQPYQDGSNTVVVLTALPADALVVVAITGDLEARRERRRQRVFAPVVHRVAVGIPFIRRTGCKAPDLIPAGDEQTFGLRSAIRQRRAGAHEARRSRRVPAAGGEDDRKHGKERAVYV